MNTWSPNGFAPPAGALCARHPQAAAVATCARCGSFACAECAVWGNGQLVYCGKACEPVSHSLAERGSRLVASLVDGLGVYLPMVVLAIISENTSGALRGIAGLLAVLWLLALLGVQLYFAASGQSIGKRILSLRVVRTDGSPASLARIVFLRNGVIVLLGSLCGVVSLIDALMIFGEERRCLHDQLADTIVVNVARG